MTRSACILGCAGLAPTAEERAFFADVRPWGFILFGRNIETPDQARALVAALRDAVDDPAAPILIDQEGGRVQRLGPPHWPAYPPAAALREPEVARLGARLMARDLAGLGITVDCAPVLDLPQPDTTGMLGERAYSTAPEEAARLGRAVAEGLLAGGVLPVIKHIPGHGRARADSHHELPVVDASLAELEAHDFAPFRALADLPLAMSAHVVFAAIDRTRPATTSAKVIAEIVRGAIGFQGLLMTDDLSMKALSGGFAERARRALAAGCDVVLHCNGDMAQMRAVAAAAGPLEGLSAVRANAALARICEPAQPFDAGEARARFEAALGERWTA